MEGIHLLTVEDRFDITGRGLVLVPDFSVPNSWEDRTEIACITTPDGRVFECKAVLSVTHFSFGDRIVPVDKRYGLVLILTGLRKEELPVGSRISVSEDAHKAIFEQNEGA